MIEDTFHERPQQDVRSARYPWIKRPRSPGLKWAKNFVDKPETCTSRVFLIDYIRQSKSKVGMRKVAAREFNELDSLRRLYSNHDRDDEAVLRLIHVQNAPWATRFLLRKFNIHHRDDLVGTDFGKYVKNTRPERRGSKPFMSGRSWKTTRDPWRGIIRTSFGLDYPKPLKVSGASAVGARSYPRGKLMELNSYDENNNPIYGHDVVVQRISCYVQLKEGPANVPAYPDIENPYEEGPEPQDPQEYVPHLDTLDNGSTIIIFEDSETECINDTLIPARQLFESRWRRLPFYLANESHEISNDDKLAVECTKMILEDIWRSVTGNWEYLLDICNNHISILEDKIYEEPADESRAPELWINSSRWLKVERLIAIHANVVKEMQLNLREMSADQTEDNWLETNSADMERISALIQEDLVKPTANLADLMYKSVGIRDSRHGLQLNTSMWRLSWITFIFLPLTFMVGFFGMNVDVFSDDPSIKWYFVVAVPMMAIVFIGWFFFKHAIARQRQTPYSRGIYEHLFHEMAIQYPSLWSRSGPREGVRPEGFFDKLRWRLIIFWNRPVRTDDDAEWDDLGTWARCKTFVTRRWTSQIRSTNRFIVQEPATALEEADDGTELVETAIGKATDILALPVTENALNLPGGRLTIQTPPDIRTQHRLASPRQSIDGRPTSQGSSKGRNSGVMVEEERPTWLQDLAKGIHLSAMGSSKDSPSGSRRPSHAASSPLSEVVPDN